MMHYYILYNYRVHVIFISKLKLATLNLNQVRTILRSSGKEEHWRNPKTEIHSYLSFLENTCN